MVKEWCPGAGDYRNRVVVLARRYDETTGTHLIACPVCGHESPTAAHGMNATIRRHKREVPVEHLQPGDVIMPGAFGTEPQTVPLKDAPGGNVIGTATVYRDGSMDAEITDGSFSDASGMSAALPTVEVARLGQIDASRCVRIRFGNEDFTNQPLPSTCSVEHPAQVVAILPDGGYVHLAWAAPHLAYDKAEQIQHLVEAWAKL